jgi:hypothetical protein
MTSVSLHFINNIKQVLPRQCNKTFILKNREKTREAEEITAEARTVKNLDKVPEVHILIM